jgi:hypothetical protein
MQTIDETLFAYRKEKERKCSKQLTKYPFNNFLYTYIHNDKYMSKLHLYT